MIVTAALDSFLNVYFGGQAAAPEWYIGLITTGIAISPETTLGELAAVEFVSYASATRPVWTRESIPGGMVITPTISKAEFLSNAALDATITGAFVVSNSTKGGTAGVLLYVEKFPSPRILSPASTLRVGASFILSNVG